MDLRTFRRNDPGRAECEAQAAWRRLWADRRAHRSRDTRGPGLERGRILATIWIPGANPFNLGALVPPNLSVRSSQVRGCSLQLEREEEGRGLAREHRVLEVESKSVLSGSLDHSSA